MAAVPEVPISPAAAEPSRADEQGDQQGDQEVGGILQAGRILAAAIIAVPVIRAAAGGTPGQRAGVGALFGAAALVVWAVAAWAQRWLLFGRLLQRQVSRGNAAAALATAANQVALALIVSRAVCGDAVADLPAALAFGGIALLTWGIFVALFRSVTVYPDGPEIAAENHAAALSYAGAALALALMIAHAVDGPFVGWGGSFGAYGAALIAAVALYPVRQLVVGGLLLRHRPRWRGGELDRAIGQRRSLGVAALEAAAYFAAALLTVGLT